MARSSPLSFNRRNVYVIGTLALGSLALSSAGNVGLHSPAQDSQNTPNAGIQQIIGAGHFADLRWPDFRDYRDSVQNFYKPVDYAPAWINNGQPSQQARAVIQVLQSSADEGLDAEDYDASRWPTRLDSLQKSSSVEQEARFDVGLTICVMRYISDLHIGRVNPRRLDFALDVGMKKYDLAAFVRSRLVGSDNIQAELDGVEPPFTGYRRTQHALKHYVELAKEDSGEQLPIPQKPVEVGNSYVGVPRLVQLLCRLGDLTNCTPGSGEANVYSNDLADAVRHFQERHGLSPDGRLGQETLRQLNTPLRSRLKQLQLTLERWRWLPFAFPQPPIVVNIPEFRLRAYDNSGKIALHSRVIVGKAYRHRTPVFERNMRFVVLRPYWNVPPSIQRSEIVPAVKKNRNYIANRNYEVTTPRGEAVSSNTISDDVLQQLSRGELLVRQKPGPTNALGLVKLMFPNEYNVYLHSTPAAELFAHTRRDFSHGCIRVEKADELVAWVLRDQPGWSLERVRAAMRAGVDNLQINLSHPIPVLILYGTAIVDQENQVHFFGDIYGHDAALQKALSQGYPYPH